MSTSERMLRLLGLLQTHRYWPGRELAERLDVSDRTLRRDVDRLRDLGYEVDAVRGVAGGYQLRAGRALPPLLLDNDEAVAIAVGLRSSASTVIDGEGDAAVRALTKVVAMLPPTLKSRMDALQTMTIPGPQRQQPHIDASALTTLAACCRDREIARFRYQGRGAEPTERRVEPHQLVSFEQRWYLVAYDLYRQDWRTFRLDRLSEVVTRGDRFRRREIPGGSALEHVRAGRQRTVQTHHVQVWFDCDPEVVRHQVWTWGDVTAAPNGGCTWSIDMGGDLTWALYTLVAVDAPCRVISPPELVERVAAAARRLGEP